MSATLAVEISGSSSEPAWHRLGCLQDGMIFLCPPISIGIRPSNQSITGLEAKENILPRVVIKKPSSLPQHTTGDSVKAFRTPGWKYAKHTPPTPPSCGSCSSCWHCHRGVASERGWYGKGQQGLKMDAAGLGKRFFSWQQRYFLGFPPPQKGYSRDGGWMPARISLWVSLINNTQNLFLCN